MTSAGKSLSYWSTANGDDTMVTIWNPADEAQSFIFRLMFAGGHYDRLMTLGPRATAMFDVSEIINGAGPDLEGNVIPPGVQEGSAKIVGIEADNQHILLAMDSGVYNVRKATCFGQCTSCDGATGFTVLASPFGLAVNGQKQESVHAQWNTGAQYDYTTTSTWTSSNTSVATVLQPGLAHGVAVGSFTFSAGVSNVPLYSSCYPYGCPLLGGGGGSSSGDVATVSCTPSTVTRGYPVTCTASGPYGSTFSNWTFSDGANVVIGGGGSTWQGIMVETGTVSVTVTGTDSSVSTPSAVITVLPRNWHTSPASATKVANGTFITLPTPPQPTGLDAGLGQYDWKANYNGGSGSIVSGGPNSGYYYYPSKISFSTFYFHYEINPDLENTASTFYIAQCGNYNASTKPGGFIAGSALLAQTNRHEWNSSSQSHYAFYSSALNSHNLGDYLEARVAPPGTNLSNFDAATADGLNSDNSAIASSTQVEPYAVNESETGVFLGNINYSPYVACQ